MPKPKLPPIRNSTFPEKSGLRTVRSKIQYSTFIIHHSKFSSPRPGALLRRRQACSSAAYKLQASGSKMFVKNQEITASTKFGTSIQSLYSADDLFAP
ncbi:MAG: hypothetical protein U5K35_10350 [Rhodohalobacter sp.]|nr:hypothetical protein [Rhodohalobacter sp.]